MAKKSKCSGCNGDGLLPWCPTCFKRGHLTKEAFEAKHQYANAVAAEALRIKKMSTAERIAHERQLEIQRHKHLENVKDLKKALSNTLRSRRLYTGVPGVDEIARNIVNEAIETIHEEIETGVLETIAQVVSRFNELVETPDYSHEDRSPEEVEKYLEEKNGGS